MMCVKNQTGDDGTDGVESKDRDCDSAKQLIVVVQAQAAAIMAVAVPTMAHSSIPTSLPALLQQVS